MSLLRVLMNLQNMILIFILASLFAKNAFSSEALTTVELQQVMEFDQACIIMHTNGRKYLQDKEKITHSYGASALIEQRFELRLEKYSEMTGIDLENVRKTVVEKGFGIFKELSEHQPRDLVNQCKELVENIVRTNL